MNRDDTLKPYVDEYSSRLARIEKLAELLDSKYVIPGTNIRFGWDALIGLIPGIGDTVMLLPQLYLLYEAFRSKVGTWAILRMLGNVGIDWLMGLIPVVGDALDVAYKSNLRNVRILARRIREKQAMDI